MKIRLILMFLLCGTPVFAHAQSGSTFEISKSAIVTGGGKSDGTKFKIRGSVGQAIAFKRSTGNTFSVSGGFWASKPRPNELFKDSFENQLTEKSHE
jgi:hypothetical protein